MSEFNPKELEYDVSETCEPGEMCVECIIAEMRRSKYGQALANNPPRYSDFWGGKKSFFDRGDFKNVLGHDVDPVMHGPHQAVHVAIPMIEHQNMSDKQHFTREEGKLLVIAHVFHDLHEGVTGDIPYPDKKDRRDIEEMELEINLKAVAETLLMEPDDPFLAKYRAIVGDLEHWSFLGRAFTAGEHCGYFQTGLKAWSLRHHLPLNNMQKQAMERMGREVTLSILPKLEEWREEFPYAGYLLEANAYALEEMQKST